MAMRRSETWGPTGLLAVHVWSDGTAQGDLPAGYYEGQPLVRQRDLTSDEATRVAADDANKTTVTNEETLTQRAQAALTTNAMFLTQAANVTYPLTQAEQKALVDQVVTVTKECSALIRLALSLLDSTDGT